MPDFLLVLFIVYINKLKLKHKSCPHIFNRVSIIFNYKEKLNSYMNINKDFSNLANPIKQDSDTS